MTAPTPEAFMTQAEPDEDETLSEIDRNARAYGFEIGKGQPLAEVIEQNHPDNPFMDPTWRDRIGDAPAMAPYDPSPLDSIAQSLRQLVEAQEERNGWNRPRGLTIEPEELDTLVDAAQELADLEAKYNSLFKLLADVEKIVMPSTSKLANSVRGAITAWRNPEVPEPEPGDLVHGAPTGGKSPCGVHYMEGTFGTDPTCPECSAAETRDNQPAHDADVEEWRSYAIAEGLPADAASGLNRSQIRTALGIEQPSGDA